MSFKRWVLPLIGVLFSVGAIYLVMRDIDFIKLGEALQGAKYGWLIPAFFLITLGLFFRGLRWRSLLSKSISLEHAFNILNIAYLLNGILPLRAGELARAYLASQVKPPVPMMRSASTIIIERLLDLLAVLVLIGIVLLVAPIPEEVRAPASLFLPLMIVGFAFLMILASKPDFSLNLAHALSRRIPILERFQFSQLTINFIEGLKPLTQMRTLIEMVLWTAVSWTFSVISGYVIMLAFYDQADWIATCLFTATASFAIAVPAIPGNLGTYEASIVFALSTLNFDPVVETAAAFALVVHGLNLFANIVLGIWGLFREGFSIKQISTGVRNMQQKQAAGSIEA